MGEDLSRAAAISPLDPGSENNEPEEGSKDSSKNQQHCAYNRGRPPQRHIGQLLIGLKKGQAGRKLKDASGHGDRWDSQDDCRKPHSWRNDEVCCD